MVCCMNKPPMRTTLIALPRHVGMFEICYFYYSEQYTEPSYVSVMYVGRNGRDASDELSAADWQYLEDTLMAIHDVVVEDDAELWLESN